MRRIVAVLALVVALVGATDLARAVASAAPAGRVAANEPGDAATVVAEIFWAEGCPYCARARAFLAELAATEPDLEVREYELSGSADNRARFAAVAEELGFDPVAVPTIVLDGAVWIGFDDDTAEGVRAAVEARVADTPGAGDAAADPVGDDPVDDDEVIDVPLVGEIDVGERSLLVATLAIAFVDGVNPCSLWVLSILLALVLHTGSRRRVLAVGAVFLTVTTALYGLYIVGLYGVLSYVAYLSWIRLGVAAIAVAFGALAVKDYFWPGRGPSLSISPAQRPTVYRWARGLSSPGRSLATVLAATAAMAVGVSLVETPCTAGFPVVWTNLLAEQRVGLATASLLFGAYMAVFLVDELLVFGAVVTTMRATRLQERQGRLLKLVGGVVMLALAGVMVLSPELLEDVGATLAVFGAAGAVVLLVVLVERLVAPEPTSSRSRSSRPAPRVSAATRRRHSS